MGIEQEPAEVGFFEELEEYLTLSKEQVTPEAHLRPACGDEA
jgi:hypothetical protein